MHPAFCPSTTLGRGVGAGVRVGKSQLTRITCSVDANESGGGGVQDEGRLSGLLPVISRTARAMCLSAALLLAPGSARAARGGDVMLTDQVANFTLPSVESASSGSGESLGARVVLVAKRVIPPAAAVALTAFVLVKVVRRAEERRLRDFKSQLQSLSSMLTLDADALDKVDKPEDKLQIQAQRKKKAAAAAAAVGMGTSQTQAQTKSRESESKEELGSKVRLDLFQNADGDASASTGAITTPEADVPDVVPGTDFERAAAEFVREIGKGASTSRIEAELSRVRAVGSTSGLDAAGTHSALAGYVSRVVSMHVDRVARHLDSEDADAVKNLSALSGALEAALAVNVDSALKYTGRHAADTAMREELYKRYAVYCLNSHSAGAGSHAPALGRVDRLLDAMQTLLGVSDARAEGMNKELAKGMFQVAVSAAMVDGALDENARKNLDKLKDAFSTFLEGNDADSIMSEVAVMRAMYALQQLLSDSGVGEDDVVKLRKMCADLGVDVDEMMKNADALGNVLGPEAKQFVQSLTEILGEVNQESDNQQSVLTTTATAVATKVDDSTQPSTTTATTTTAVTDTNTTNTTPTSSPATPMSSSETGDTDTQPNASGKSNLQLPK